MSYQVIARKYRPQRFADVVGQEHVTQTLANAIQQKRIAHAYLFCGPRGTGKTTTARIFAKALNCTDGPKVDFDENDPRCLEIAEGRSLDVIEIDGASNRGIDEIRDLRDTVKYAPATSKFKIYIIDEVHMLTKEAFNALLKTLEEPPAHAKFMFATTEPEKVLPTILSRCQRFDLRRIPTALIVEHLGLIARQEKVTIDDAALYAIARGADGGMRDAESTLDQLISFCGTTIQEPDVLSMFGLTGRKQILELSGAVLAGDVEPALRTLNDLAKNGKDLGRLVGDLLNHFRNLLIFQISKGDLQLLEVSEAEAAALAEQVKGTDSGMLGRILEVFTECEGRLRDAASKKILIEVALMKAIEARNAMPIDAVLRQLNQLRGDASPSAGAASHSAATASTPRPSFSQPARTATAEPRAVTPPPQASSPTPTAAPPVTAPAGATDLFTLWGQILDAVGRVSAFTRSYFLEAHPVSFEKKLLTIGFDPEYADHLPLVDNAKNHQLIQTKLAELGHHGCMVKFIKAEAPANWERTTESATSAPAPVAAPASVAKTAATAAKDPAPAPKPKAEPQQISKDEFKSDPLIKKALEIFKGTIVDARA
ncbi:MAG TPA: DNA polymerase III subunit gamma/tau [Roseimicrobium sp.]|nr:DNA polymerase III subunit gamma/tau [Roseimicrobium sp.]